MRENEALNYMKEQNTLNQTFVQSGYALSHSKAKQLTTDYLKALRRHIDITLDCHDEASLERVPREYIFTVPQEWSESTTDVLFSCAVDAGMKSTTSLPKITELEAAARWVAQNINFDNLKIGDTFVLCNIEDWYAYACSTNVIDLTNQCRLNRNSDLASYFVQGLRPSPLLMEAAPGTGSSGGGINLYLGVVRFLYEKLGEEVNLEDKETVDRAIGSFMSFLRKDFDGTRSADILAEGSQAQPYAPVFKKSGMFSSAKNLLKGRTRKDSGSTKSRPVVSINDLKEILGGFVSNVLTLIGHQIRNASKQVNRIFLVGDFAGSLYLQKRIKRAFPNIELTLAQNQ